MGPRPNGRGKRLWLQVPSRAYPASMGPRPNGRGKQRRGALAPRARARVNGAAAKRPRKAGWWYGPVTSSRPRQWGRGQTAAERSRRPHPRHRAVASMGRGQTAAERGNSNNLQAWGVRASMGPRPNGRGKRYTRAARLEGGPLRQWGRGQTAAERPEPGIETVPVARRQWGRGQTAAESVRRHDPRARSRYASMGPRPNGRGKHACARPLKSAHLASMGPRPNGRGKTSRARALPPRRMRVNGAAAKRPRKGRGPGAHACPQRLASMGPRPNGRGKAQISVIVLALALVCVNGAAAKRPRKGGYAGRH